MATRVLRKPKALLFLGGELYQQCTVLLGFKKNVQKQHGIEPPRTGVEIVSSEKRQGVIYHTVRDLRNGNLIRNVTKSSARKLWHYAITQAESGSVVPKKVQWHKDRALLKQRKKGDNVWYDLALRSEGQVHVYYGVTDSGMNSEWLSLVGENS